MSSITIHNNRTDDLQVLLHEKLTDSTKLRNVKDWVTGPLVRARPCSDRVSTPRSIHPCPLLETNREGPLAWVMELCM